MHFIALAFAWLVFAKIYKIHYQKNIKMNLIKNGTNKRHCMRLFQKKKIVYRHNAKYIQRHLDMVETLLI